MPASQSTRHKWCRHCKRWKTVDKYHRTSLTRKDDLHGWCRDCCKEYVRERRARRKVQTPDEQAQEDRGRRWWAKYRLREEEYYRLLAEQGGCCAICGGSSPGGAYNIFQVDHCHKTGAIRGLLCSKCNRGLALLGDTVEAITRVLNYLAGITTCE
jgi:hypothetical protein